MELERTSRRKTRQIQLTSLIDVMVLLLVFFMLTTSFAKVESMELSLPSAGEVSTADERKIIHIFVADNDDLFLEQNKIEREDFQDTIKDIIVRNPNQPILVLSASKVTVQALVRVMDQIYLAGGRSVAVADWNKPAPAAEEPALMQEEPPHGI